MFLYLRPVPPTPTPCCAIKALSASHHIAAPFPFQLSPLFLFAAVPPLAPPFFLAACPPINPFSALTQFIHCLSPAPLSPSLAPPFLFSARPPSIASSRTPHPFPLTSPFIAAAAPFIATIPHSSIPYSSSSVFAHRPLIHSPSPPLVV